MRDATDRLEFVPPPEPGQIRSIGLALLAHACLLAALTWGVRWKTETVTTVTAQAELWSALPQQAAPKLAEPPPTNPPVVIQPKPLPKPLPVVPPKPVALPPPKPIPLPPLPKPLKAPVTAPVLPIQPKVDIALEQEKQRLKKEKAKEKEREKARQIEKEAQKEAEKAKAREKAKEQDKQRLDKLKQEKIKQEKLQLKEKQQQEQREQTRQAAAEEKKKLAQEAKRKEAQQAQQAQQEAQKIEAQRQANLKRMAGLANASGGPTATGTALHTSGPSSSYAGRIRARIKPNIVFSDDIAGNPMADVEVRTSPDGTIVSRTLKKPSGVKSWDEAVLRAIDKTEVLPRDVDGRVISPLTISFKPKD